MTDPRVLAGLALCAFGLAACDADTGGVMQAATSMPSVQELTLSCEDARSSTTMTMRSTT